jgi:predicted acetyltransferase
MILLTQAHSANIILYKTHDFVTQDFYITTKFTAKGQGKQGVLEIIFKISCTLQSYADRHN